MEYSLLQRGIEREVLPAAAALGLGRAALVAAGRRGADRQVPAGTPADSRAASPHFARFIERFLDERSRGIVDAVCTAATAWTAARWRWRWPGCGTHPG